MAHTLTEKAVVGRRIAFTYYRDLKKPTPPEHPGIITDLVPAQGASVKIRLDGKRSSLHVPPDYQGLRYLDEVLDAVPSLPMGRFQPTAEQIGGTWEGVPVCLLESPGEEVVIALTGDREAARTAVTAYLKANGWDPDYFKDLAGLKAGWAVFDWEPEDADTPWTARWDAAEGDDQAIRIHYLTVS